MRSLEKEELARSLINAFHYALGHDAPVDGDSLPDGIQHCWIHLATHALSLCETNAGREYAQVAILFHHRWCGGAGEWLNLGQCQWVAWEAVVRHCMAILDGELLEEGGDGLAGLGDLEQTWREWAAKKLAPSFEKKVTL